MLLTSLSNVGVVDLEVCCPIFGIFHFAPRYFNIIDRSKLSVGRVPNCCFLKRCLFFCFSKIALKLFFLKTPLVLILVFLTTLVVFLRLALFHFSYGGTFSFSFFLHSFLSTPGGKEGGTLQFLRKL